MCFSNQKPKKEAGNINWAKLMMNKPKLKGGIKMSETKSRYEVIAELEGKKRNLIFERESFVDKVRSTKKEIRNSERELEDEKEDLVEFEKSIVTRKETINELIKSIDDSLARFAELAKK